MSDVIEPAFSKPQLNDVGTRYRHLADLLEIFENGLDAVNATIDRSGATQTDTARQKSLEATIYLIRKQIFQMSDFDAKQFRLRDEVSKIEPTGWRKKVDK